MSTKIVGAIGVAVLVVAAAIVLISSGNNNDAQASDTDGAFLTEMTPHHESAIEMAKIAQRRAEHPQIKQLADDIISAQEQEVSGMDSIHQRLFNQPLSEGEHGTLGLADDMMGMSMDTSTLETANPFDRAFIDEMIPHHQGAIRMARIEIADGSDQQTTDLARAIIAAQSAEIEQMNQWRNQWYGAPSPAGGIPAMNEKATPAHDGMDMGS